MMHIVNLLLKFLRTRRWVYIQNARFDTLETEQSVTFADNAAGWLPPATRPDQNGSSRAVNRSVTSPTSE